jgi:hypothetical protein
VYIRNLCTTINLYCILQLILRPFLTMISGLCQCKCTCITRYSLRPKYLGTEGVYHWINLALQISLNKISSFLHDGSLIVFESQTKMSLDFKIPSFRQKEVAKRARTLGCVVYTSEPLAAKYPSCKVVWVHFCCCIRTHCTQLTNMIHKKFAPFVMIEWII